MHFLFFYNYRTFSWAHGCWIKDYISQPPIGVAMWQVVANRRRAEWCVPILGHTPKGKDHIFPFSLLPPDGWTAMWWWLSEQSSQTTRWKPCVKDGNQALEVAGGPEPAKSSYLWHEADMDCCLVKPHSGCKRNTQRFIVSYFFEIEKFHVCCSSWSKMGKFTDALLRLPPSVLVFTIINTTAVVLILYSHCFKEVKEYEHESQQQNRSSKCKTFVHLRILS